MHRAFKYRLYPTRQQERAFAGMLETHRHLYNAALAERHDAYQHEKRSISYGQQSGQLKGARAANPYLAKTNFSSCQATLRRLDRAFGAFFRRVKAGETPGYPRFKGKNRFDTVEFPSYGDGCKLACERAYFQHVGYVKIKMHRPLQGQIKTMAFKREADGWHVVFCCDLGEPTAEPSSKPPVGIDLGLKAFLVTSDGATVEPPRFQRRAERQLRRAQRCLARRRKRSNRRNKARLRVAKLHLHIQNQRRDFHHKTARALVETHGVVVHEDLNVSDITHTHLAKSAYDAGWASFLQILHSKAAEAGVQVFAVPPAYTSQACSQCGWIVPKTLAERVHVCPQCGYIADRDLNAAQNIERLGIERLGLSRQALTATVVAVA